LNEREVKNKMTIYRVWVHPKRGSDYAHDFSSKEEAELFIAMNPLAERDVYIAGGKSLLSSETLLKKKKFKVPEFNPFKIKKLKF